MFPEGLPAEVPVLPVVVVPGFPIVDGLDAVPFAGRVVVFEGRVVVLDGRDAVLDGWDVGGCVRVGAGCCAGALA
jgi:hypothetical protein